MGTCKVLLLVCFGGKQTFSSPQHHNNNHSIKMYDNKRQHSIVFRGLMGVWIYLKEVINTYKNTLSVHFFETNI